MTMWLWMAAWGADPGVVDGLLEQYRREGVAAPDPVRGRSLWTEANPAPDGGGTRSCETCHGGSLDAPGRHAKTGKPIAPMTDPDRLTDPAEIEKWFGRNCRWTLGRACTSAEKADLLVFLASGGR